MLRAGATFLVDAYEGHAPACCVQEYQIIRKRALALVRNRDLQQLEKQRETLNWMLVDVYPEAFFETDENESDEKDSVSMSTRLYNAMDDYSLDDPDNLTWPEYFGLLALIEIAQAISWDRFFPRDKLDDSNMSMFYTGFAHHAINAMEAVCYGEQLVRPNQIEKELDKLAEEKYKRKISLRASNAAIKRNDKTRALREDFSNYYFSGSFPSKREAARRFLKSLPNEKRRLLAESNALRTLTGWIAGYKKSSDA